MALPEIIAALVTGIISMVLFTMPVHAQDVDSVQQLQRLIDAQQLQLETQQKLLEAQQKQLDLQTRSMQMQTQSMQKLEKRVQSLIDDKETSRAIAAAPPPTEVITQPAKPPPSRKAGLSRTRVEEKETTGAIAAVPLPTESVTQPAKPSPSRIVGLSHLDRYDSTSPTATNFQVGDHSQTLKIPDSEIEIGIHGFAEFQIIHDTDGMDNNEFDTVKINVDGAPSQTKFNVNPSRLEVSVAKPIEVGQLNAFISMDFNGELDSPHPRLRMAYGEWVNDDLGISVLAGQAYNTMLDLQAIPETLDFAGPAALFEQRQPMLRVTKAFADSFVAEVSIETPENTTYVNANRLTRWPDFALAGTWHADGKYLKHLRLAGLARDLRAEDDDSEDDGSSRADSTFGWAIYGSAKLGLPLLDKRDNLKINVHYGDGYGTQLKGGPDEAVFDTVNGELHNISIFGSYVGLQHWWSSTWRTNLVYGYVNADNPGFADGDLLDNTTYTAANLVWNPYKKVTVGLEYLWGRRKNKDGANGTDNRFLFSSKFEF
jgi:hypothetical protein